MGKKPRTTPPPKKKKKEKKEEHKCKTNETINSTILGCLVFCSCRYLLFCYVFDLPTINIIRQCLHYFNFALYFCI